MLASGTKLGHYEVIEAIGAGGMGEVYRARDERLRRDVAIKVLPASVQADPQRLERFEHEARATGGLNHPGIVSVFDVGEHDGAPYLVIEMLDGQTLRERLRSGPLPVRKAVEYGVQIAQALAAAHDQGIVHRDLKPDNLFVTRDGRVKILDFGLAKAMEESPAREGTLTADRTDSGGVLGTAGYMAPEQVRGKAVDHRADVFAFGVVLYEMLTGAAPFAKPTPIDRALATLNDDPPPLTARELTPALEAIVRRCLEKSAEERFQSARDLAFALQSLSTTTSGAGTKAQAPRSRWPKLAVALVGVALVLGTGYVIGSRVTRASVATPRPPPLTFQRVAYRNGDIKRARFAPDGHTIVFGAQFDGDDFPHVYSAVSGGIEPRALYDRPMDLLDVAPNGELALALKSSSFALARASLAGGEPRVLAEPFGRAVRDYEDASWGPDGETLLQSRRLDGKQLVEYPAGTVLVNTPDEGIVVPRVSPDGSLVAFTRSEIASFFGDRIEVVDRTGHRRVVFAADQRIRSIAWHPDGREIWFTTRQQLRAVSLDGSERLITELPGVMTIEQIARDNRALLIRRDDTVHLVTHVADVDRELTWQNASFVEAISDDGKRLLFGEDGTDKPHAYVRWTDGRAAVRIGEGNAEELSADGAWAVLFHGFPSVEIEIVPTGAGQPRTFTLGPRVKIDEASFFQDGKRLLIYTREPGKPSRMWIADLSTSAPPRPVGPEGIASLSRLADPSLDGTRVLVDLAGKLVLVPLGAGEPIPVPGIDDDVPIAWAVDGRSIYLLHRADNDDVSVLQFDLDTHVKTPKVRIDKATARDNDWIEHVVITPDGSTYAYDYVHASSQLFLVEGLR